MRKFTLSKKLKSSKLVSWTILVCKENVIDFSTSNFLWLKQIADKLHKTCNVCMHSYRWVNNNVLLLVSLWNIQNQIVFDDPNVSNNIQSLKISMMPFTIILIASTFIFPRLQSVYFLSENKSIWKRDLLSRWNLKSKCDHETKHFRYCSMVGHTVVGKHGQSRQKAAEYSWSSLLFSVLRINRKSIYHDVIYWCIDVNFPDD